MSEYPEVKVVFVGSHCPWSKVGETCRVCGRPGGLDRDGCPYTPHGEVCSTCGQPGTKQAQGVNDDAQ